VSELRRYDYVVQNVLTQLSFGTRLLRSTHDPAPGDLVLLTHARQNDWHLSFCISGQRYGVHLLESVKTGKVAHWSNVSFCVVQMKPGEWPKMRWTDDMFAFEDKFRKVCKRLGVYIDIPFIDGFAGDTVLIKIRTRFALDEHVTVLEPQCYRRMTQKAIAAHLIAGIEAHKATRATHRSVAAVQPATTQVEDTGS
jgi:hypothetical protein